jgi:energy-coupling factor transporter ATP-binding protein EcfA2
LSRVAKQGTNHFKKIWKEYRDVEFVLDPDGGNIIAAVKEENQYDMSQRSDGFKRFIAFLLIISTHVLKDNFKNTLLIVDEPEIGLHPSAVRDLRDELIKIAEHSNYVIFSTHSIFMVDNKHVERHIRVKKEKEITDIIFNNDSSFMDEEVIYNAMNYSVFETLRENNILFEGWRDKHLFEVFVGRKVFNEIGLCFAKGIKNIKNIAPMLQLANRKLIIVSDADNTALQHKSEFIADQYYGTWYTYNDLSKKEYEVITAEYFLKTELH